MYTDKIDFVTKNLEQLQETILRKQDNLQTVVEIMRVKAIQQRAAQQGSGATAAA